MARIEALAIPRGGREANLTQEALYNQLGEVRMGTVDNNRFKLKSEQLALVLTGLQPRGLPSLVDVGAILGELEPKSLSFRSKMDKLQFAECIGCSDKSTFAYRIGQLIDVRHVVQECQRIPRSLARLGDE